MDLNDIYDELISSITFKFLRGHSEYDYSSDIDILTDEPKKCQRILEKNGFVKIKYLNKDSGFFMKKLTPKGVINFHIQTEIFFVNKNKMYVIKGLNELVLTENCPMHFLYMMKFYYEGRLKTKYISFLEEYYKKSFQELDLEYEIYKFLEEKNLTVSKRNIKLDIFIRSLYKKSFYFIPHTIQLSGMDGSGKSSVSEKLNEIMGNRAMIVYMGKKNWQIKIAKNAFDDKSFSGFFNIMILYLEFVYRFTKAMKNNKIIIFDRYPSEMFLWRKGLRRKIYFLLFNCFFPSSKYQFYLKCSVESALKRKKDIVDIDNFVKRKKILDDFYSNTKQIDTTLKNLDETLEYIIGNLPRNLVVFL